MRLKWRGLVINFSGIFLLFGGLPVFCTQPVAAQAASHDASADTGVDESIDAEAPVEKRKASKKKKLTVYDFEATEVTGQRKTPDGLIVIDRNNLDFKSQILIRKNFTQEILKSVDDL